MKSASARTRGADGNADQELTERFGNRDKVTVTSGSRTVLKALNELTPELSRGLVAEYAWLDPLKVAQHYGCALLAPELDPMHPGTPAQGPAPRASRLSVDESTNRR